MNLLDLVAKIVVDSSDYDKGLNEAENKAGKSSKNIMESLTKVSTVASGAVLGAYGAMYKLVDSTAQSADTIDKASQKIGISATAYQEWGFILEHCGSDVSVLQTSMKTLTNAVTGQSADQVEAFKKVGISLDDLSKMSQEDIFGAVIKGLQGMDEGMERSEIASTLLGKAYQDLAPLLNTTAEETEAMKQQIHDLGGVMSDDAVKAGASYEDAVTNLKRAFSGMGTSIASDLLPVAVDLMNKATDFFTKNDIAGKVKKIIETFEKLAPIILTVSGVVLTLNAGIKAYNTVTAIMTTLTKAQQVATTLMTGAQTAFNAVNIASVAPILGVVGAITAIIAIIVVCVKHWDEIKATVQKVVANVKSLVESMKQSVTNAFNNIVNGISNFANKAVSKVIEIKNGIINTLKNLPSEAWEIGKNLIEGLWNGISSMVDWIKDKVGGFAETIVGGVKKVFGVHSPSKVFAEIGGYLAEGLGVGWEDEIGDVKKSIENGLDATVGNLNANVKTNLESGSNGLNSSILNGYQSQPQEIIVPIYLGNKILDELIIDTKNRVTLRSGGMQSV